jgi:hypothetical protein
MTSVGEDREPASWLAGEVRVDPLLLRDAHRVYADRGGQEDGYLAARRLLDERLRQMVHWPAGQEYARLAEDLDADGRWADAALLRQIAATDHLLTEAQTRWNTRYATRPRTADERDTRRLIDAGLIDFDPDGSYRGIDGSNYWPGYTSLETGQQQAPVVLVSGRGLWQLVTGFDDQAAVERWLHDRGPMASGPLIAPDVPLLPRAVLEEHILARMLYRPGDLPASLASLPLTTFTADGRYDIYAAIITVARTGQRWNLEHVAAELGRRMDWVPEWALPSHGGQGTPWPQAYLGRLANTEPLGYAVPRLLAEDTQARLESAAPEVEAQLRPGTARRTSEMRGTGRWPEHTNEAGWDAIPQTWRPSIGRRPEGPAPRI